MSLVWWLAATGSLFKSIETGRRHPADAVSARFSCQDIFCGETHNMLVAKITLPQPTHTTDRWYWMISHKPRLRAVTTFSTLVCQEFSNPYSCIICSPHMLHDGGFFRIRRQLSSLGEPFGNMLATRPYDEETISQSFWPKSKDGKTFYWSASYVSSPS